MPAGVSLALAIHNHQPVGNFGWVIADVYEHAYLPMLEALERHPTVRMALHYTGPLLEWLRAERPDFVERLRSLIARDQVEMMGGGLYEPILAALPARDRVAQLGAMADAVESIAGRRPTGAWLAERVWEPDLPSALAGAGYRWTILDDAHFRAAAVPEDRLWGAWVTEDQGNVLTVFGTEQGLRYGIPFGRVEDVVAHLRDNATAAGDRIGVMGDDGEKFGAWPTTWQHCWGATRWVDRFFEALEANADWLTTVTPSGWLERQPPIGRVYVPTSSYAEMGEWALPADEAAAYAEVVHRAVAERRPETRWLRGAFWRNFLVRYREANDLHKQMLRASAKVAAMPPGVERDSALRHLHRGQSNDCYWHGLFGGIYISHMRLATHAELIAAEDAADAVAGVEARATVRDVDCDGRPEVILEHPGQVVVVDLDEGAGIGTWDVRAVRHALTAVLRRRPEAYHERLRRHEAEAGADGRAATGAPSSAADSGAADGEGSTAGAAETTSIHELVHAKEKGLSNRLRYDAYERRSGLVRLLDPFVDADGWADGAPDLAGSVDGPWQVESVAARHVTARRVTHLATAGRLHAVRLEKELFLGGDRARPTLSLEVSVESRSDTPVRCRVGIEWATTMLGGGANPAAWWEVGGERTAHDGTGSASGIVEVAQGNDDIGVEVRTTATRGADAWWAPIETVSNSEAGFERVYQGSALLLSWPVELGPGERVVVRVDHVVETTRDLAAEEALARTPR